MAPEIVEGDALIVRWECGGVGVLRLRSCFALRSGYFAQDDSVCWDADFRGGDSGSEEAESGERRAESGERRAESGERRAESGERRAESGERRVSRGLPSFARLDGRGHPSLHYLLFRKK